MTGAAASELRDKHAVIVGGSSGIGFATARAFLEQGARVTIVARDEAKLEAAAQRLDESDRVAIAPAGDGLPARIDGQVDYLVTTAGGQIVMGEFSNVGPEGWLEFLRAKALVQLGAVHALLPAMSDAASVVLVSGAAGQKAAAGLLAVGATNAAIEAAGRILAVELAPKRVNVVSPGFVRTEAYDAMSEAQIDRRCSNKRPHRCRWRGSVNPRRSPH